MNKNNTKPVIITDPQGNETEYPSQSQASRAISCTQATVSCMCRGMVKGWKGYKARFKFPEAQSMTGADHVAEA